MESCIDMVFYMRNHPYVDALMWNGANMMKIREFIGDSRKVENVEDALIFTVKGGEVILKRSDYLVREGKKLYSLGEDEFNETYKKM